MAITGVNTTTALRIQQLTTLRTRLDDLQRQFATGQKVTTYSGISAQAQLLVGLNSQRAAIGNFQDTNTTLNARLSIAQSVLSQFDTITSDVRSAARLSTYQPSVNGQTSDQAYAASQLDQLLNLLNTQADDRYLFSGAAVDRKSVASADAILDGFGNQAGLKQVIYERNQADLGISGLGRLVIPPSSAASVAGTGADLTGASATGTTDLRSPFLASGGTMVVNGKTVTIPARSDATAILAAINNAATGATASLDANGRLVLANADATAPLDVQPSNPPCGNLLSEFGLTAGATRPPDLVPGVVNAGDTLTIQVGANPANTLTITFGAGTPPVNNLDDVATALQNLTGGTATVDAHGNISVTALDAADAITIGGTASALAQFGLTAGTTPPAAGTRVSVTEDAVGSPFGFKLAAASVFPSPGAVGVTGPTGSPKSVAFGVTGTPNVGDSLTVNVTLPDGTASKVTLTATAAAPAGTGQYTIGATPDETAANIQTALTASFRTLGKTDLTAASAVQASRDFFDVDATHAPQRVAGSNFATATSLRDGTPADTVSWYTGLSSADPRRSVTSRIDSTATVDYGMQANEVALRTVIENVAVLAAAAFSPSDPDSNAAYLALGYRVAVNLNSQSGDGAQKTSDLITDLANVQVSIKTVTSMQTQTKATLEDFVQGITGVNNEQVAAEFLTLQTQLQASLQMTSMLTQISLTNYL